MSRRAWSIAALGLLTGGALAVAGPAAPASAAADARNDTISVYDASTRTIDVLANDRDTNILFPKSLYICGVDVPAAAQEKVYVSTDPAVEEPTVLEVITAPGVSGDVTFTYRACLTGQTSGDVATVTLRIVPLANLKVTRASQRGKIKVVNPTPALVGFRWSSGSNPEPMGRRTLEPGQTVVLAVKKNRIAWAALAQDGDGFAQAGYGEVTGITKKRKK